MNTAIPSAPRSRLLAILLFFGMPAMLLTFSALDLLEIGDNSFVVDEKEFQLKGLMRRLTAPAKVGKPLDLSQIYLPGDTAGLASANLQQHLARSVAMAAGKIIETSTLVIDSDAQEIPEKRLGIRASFDISNDGLLALLHDLETGLPLVFVDKISLRRLPADEGKIEPAMLRIDLETSGRWKVPAS